MQVSPENQGFRRGAASPARGFREGFLKEERCPNWNLKSEGRCPAEGRWHLGTGVSSHRCVLWASVSAGAGGRGGVLEVCGAGLSNSRKLFGTFLCKLCTLRG